MGKYSVGFPKYVSIEKNINEVTYKWIDLIVANMDRQTWPWATGRHMPSFSNKAEVSPIIIKI